MAGNSFLKYLSHDSTFSFGTKSVHQEEACLSENDKEDKDRIEERLRTRRNAEIKAKRETRRKAKTTHGKQKDRERQIDSQYN